MAYYDEHGKITIDEVAAQADIRRIETAISSLNNSRKAIDNLIRQAMEEQGQTSVAVIDKATEMRTYIDDMLARLKETAAFISSVVHYYQLVDKNIKDTINASKSAIETIASQLPK